MEQVYPPDRNEEKSKRQDEARHTLHDLQVAGLDHITHVKVVATSREATRRSNAIKQATAREQKKIEEEVVSQEISRRMEEEWKQVFDSAHASRNPHELADLLLSQKRSYDEIVSSKQTLIQHLTEELKSLDDEYVRGLKRKGEEIDLLLERMQEQHDNYMTTAKQELQEIEKALLTERATLVEKSNSELNNILEKRRAHEKLRRQTAIEREERVEHDIIELENQRIKDAEEYNLQKIKLENDIQHLEQQLQQTKATHQLNAEKLEYNYQILTKREEENMTLLNANKRKLTRLQDIVNGLKTKLQKQERHHAVDFAAADEDHIRLLEQHEELQKKYQRFDAADRKKMNEIGKLNEDVALELVRKVLLADKIIHEQQLGLPWKNPTLDIGMKGTPLQTSLAIPENGKHVSAESLAALVRKQSDNNAIRQIMDLLCEEAGFLVDTKLHILLNTLPKEEQSLLKLDCIFKALGVETVSDIHQLVHCFSTASRYQRHEQKIELISPNDVIKAIHQFMELDKTREQQKGEDASHHAGYSGDMRKSWDSLSEILSDNEYQLWQATYKEMQKYNKILTERWNLWQDITTFERQNKDLKQLLRHHFTAIINEELEIPPTAVLLERLHGST